MGPVIQMLTYNSLMALVISHIYAQWLVLTFKIVYFYVCHKRLTSKLICIPYISLNCILWVYLLQLCHWSWWHFQSRKIPSECIPFSIRIKWEMLRNRNVICSTYLLCYSASVTLSAVRTFYVFLVIRKKTRRMGRMQKALLVLLQQMKFLSRLKYQRAVVAVVAICC